MQRNRKVSLIHTKKQATETAHERAHMMNSVDKDFKVGIINMFRGLKKVML